MSRLQLTVTGITTLGDVQRWAEVANSLGVPDPSSVEVSGVHDALTVTIDLDQLAAED